MSDKRLINVFQQKAEQVANATELLVNKTRDWQMIKQYMCNRLDEIKLTPIQQEKLKRYQYIYNQLASFKYTEQEVLSQIVTLFKVKLVQAYEDLKSTKELFAVILNVNKAFELKMEHESAKRMKASCIEIQDFKTAAVIEKNIIAILSMIEDEEKNPAEMFEGHQIEAVFDPALLGAPPITKDAMKDLLTRINEKRGKKIIIEDAYFEEIPNEKNTAL